MEKHAFITLQFVVEQESTTVDSNCMHPKVWSHGYINSSIKLKQQMNKQINSSPVFFTVLGRSILRNHDPVIKAHAYAQISAEIGKNFVRNGIYTWREQTRSARWRCVAMADSNMCVKTTAAADRMESFQELGDGELVHQQLA